MPLRSPAGFISAFFDPLKNPDAPTDAAATGGDASASVTFTAPSNVGGSAITAYYAVSNPGQITTSGATSPITATGLSNGTAYTFNVWALNSYGPSAFSAATGSVTPSLQRAIFGGGNGASITNTMQYVSIVSTGSASLFGTLSGGAQAPVGCASDTRGVFAGGSPNTSTNRYITIASTGNSTSFGSLSPGRFSFGGCSNNTRGIFFGGSGAGLSIDYITIATTGNSTYFGDYYDDIYQNAGCASTTRGIGWAGSDTSNISIRISYVTIATTGNALNFGNLSTRVRALPGSCSSATRGLLAGGYNSNGVDINTIQYITIASTGTASTFGQLTSAITELAGASSQTRGLFGRGDIQYVTIATTGNAVAFGSMYVGGNQLAGLSNCHGGI